MLRGITQAFTQDQDVPHTESIIVPVRPSIAKWTKKSPQRHTAFDGRLYLERRPRISPNWHARASFQNHLVQKTTRTSDLADAKEGAETWFLNLRKRVEDGIPVGGRTFAVAASALLTHHENTLLPIGASDDGTRLRPR